MSATAPLCSKYPTLSHCEGFTLVELLISVTIIILTTAATIPSFTSYIRNQNVQQAAEQIKSDLRGIQNKAQTGALSDQLISGNPVNYWGVRFKNGSNTYEYFASTNTTCPTAATIAANQYQGKNTINTTIGIKGITSASGYACAFFSLSNGDATTGFSGGRLIVGYNGSTTTGDCRNLYFTNPGLIYMTGLQTCT